MRFFKEGVRFLEWRKKNSERFCDIEINLNGLLSN